MAFNKGFNAFGTLVIVKDESDFLNRTCPWGVFSIELEPPRISIFTFKTVEIIMI
jgi:hypothetical protein